MRRGVDDDHAEGRGAEERALARLGLAQRQLGLLALGDVEDDPGEPPFRHPALDRVRSPPRPAPAANARLAGRRETGGTRSESGSPASAYFGRYARAVVRVDCRQHAVEIQAHARGQTEDLVQPAGLRRGGRRRSALPDDFERHHASGLLGAAQPLLGRSCRLGLRRRLPGQTRLEPQLQFVGRHGRQPAQPALLHFRQALRTRLGGEHAYGPEHRASRADERRAGVKAEARGAADQRVGGEAGIGGQIGDDEHLARPAADGVVAEGPLAWHLLHVHPDPRLEPLPGLVDQRHHGHGCPEQVAGEAPPAGRRPPRPGCRGSRNGAARQSALLPERRCLGRRVGRIGKASRWDGHRTMMAPACCTERPGVGSGMVGR